MTPGERIAAIGAGAIALAWAFWPKTTMTTTKAPVGTPDVSWEPGTVIGPTRAFQLPPDGYWYIVAYEQVRDPGSTYGSGITWSRYVYYEPTPIRDPAGAALNARIQHTHPSTPGAIRAWWWNGTSWQPWPALAQDW